MRLTAAQIEAIRQAVRAVYGPASQVRLFGSRVDDDRRGGDIDLLVELSAVPAPGRVSLEARLALLARLEHQLGERKVDVVVAPPGDYRPIVVQARASGVLL